jgi:hypothetical protein
VTFSLVSTSAAVAAPTLVMYKLTIVGLTRIPFFGTPVALVPFLP